MGFKKILNENKIFLIISIAIVLLLLFHLFRLSHGSAYNVGYKYVSPINNIVITSPYSIEELRDIKIENLDNLSQLINNYSFFLLIINPDYSGNYTVAMANLKLKIPSLILVCSEEKSGCTRYKVNTPYDDNYIGIKEVSESKIYLYPRNATLITYIKMGNESKIKKENNEIYLIGDNNTIDKVAWKFILEWYGIRSS